MNYQNNPSEELHRLTGAVKAAGTDIAPTYLEYIQMAFAIATDCGEAGRADFIELCGLSAKFDRQAAETLFTNALREHKNSVHLGTLFHLARQQGVTVATPHETDGKEAKSAKVQKSAPPFSHTRVREGDDEDEESTNGPEELTEGPEPYCPLPTFRQDHQWPAMMERILAYATSREQHDVLLLSSLNALGATLAHNLRCLYSNKWQSPCMQTFIVGPATAGKSALAWVRRLVEPIHDEIRCAVKHDMEQYRVEKAAYDAMGKGRAQTAPPTVPPNRMFLISGNNTGTGILQNIIDSDGTGIICETEADTVSTAIGAEYGNWSATLRHAFDQDRMSYNRRTDHEYLELERTYLSVLISGTPTQVRPLIPSAEDGLFSRQIFYYIPGVKEWADQFGEKDIDIDEVFLAIGREWKEKLDDIKQRGMFTLRLSERQKEAFNTTFRGLFHRSHLTNGNEMTGSVVRLAVNLCRMMSVVALLRSEDSPSLVKRPADICTDNLKDGIITRWDLRITDEDFDMMIAMAEPLYLHAAHILSFLTVSEVKGRACANKDMLFAQMDSTFTRRELIEKAEAMGIPTMTALSWLNRLIKKKNLRKGEEKGVYIKNAL